MTNVTKISRPKATKGVYGIIRELTDTPSGEALEMAARLVALFNPNANKALGKTKKRVSKKTIHYVDDSEIIIKLPKKPTREYALDQAFADGGWAVLADEKEWIMGIYDDASDTGYSVH